MSKSSLVSPDAVTPTRFPSTRRYVSSEMCQSIKTRHSVTSDQLARLGVYPYETIFSDPCACFYRDDAAPASVPSWNFHRIPDSSSSASVLRSCLLFSRLLLRTVRIRLLCSTVLAAPVLGTWPLVLPLIYARRRTPLHLARKVAILPNKAHCTAESAGAS
jgi:hypothetical protein